MTSLDKSIVMIQMSSKEYHIQDCPGSYGEEVQNQNVKVDGRLMTSDGKTSLESLDLMS
jgi:hypothetical protein